MAKSTLAHIVDYPNEPVTFLRQILHAVEEPNFLQAMNLATVDKEFGVLNRTVLFRGLTEDDCVTYATQQFTRSCKNLKANNKCAITFLFPRVMLPSQGPRPLIWQVRLIGASAVQLPESELDLYWEKDELPAQIRAIIFRTGRPSNYEKLKEKHDRFLKDFMESGEPLHRPPTFTAFKIKSLRWDFLKIGMNQIADRLQYRLQDDCQWEVMHVSS
ncbi:GH23180 [Drosophila grimshawi]|uniref:pyridoxal 5'-phosphate synthase n=1 Tax=Drosophila grimshawi TaxID=7222 RepID=B4K1I4_DROGR|nr:GH23180 [Drosophila grimshawi]